MPKHLPSFKHLIASSSSSAREKEKPDKSVNQLIAASRSNEPGRDRPPHQHTSSGPASRRGPVVWKPDAGDLSVLIACGMQGQAPIHPAELARRDDLARRQAARSAPGPIAPPSWRSNGFASPSKAISSVTSSTACSAISVSMQDLKRGAALFDRTSRSSCFGDTPKRGPVRLVEYCLMAVVGYLESTEPFYEEYEELGNGRKVGVKRVTVGRQLRKEVAYLQPHLKAALLEMGASRAAGPRLSDRSIRAILYRDRAESDTETSWGASSPFQPDDEDGDDDGNEYEDDDDDEEDDDDDWAIGPADLPEIHHLPLTIHPNPLQLLREIQVEAWPQLSLTSLNLAYSTIPALLPVINALPASLRELSLVGIRFSRAGEDYSEAGFRQISIPRTELSMEIPRPEVDRAFVTAESMRCVWRKGLAALGRKMIVLKMLDLSYPTEPILSDSLCSMLKGVKYLPSLRILGLKGVVNPKEKWDHRGLGGEILARLRVSDNDTAYRVDFVVEEEEDGR